MKHMSQQALFPFSETFRLGCFMELAGHVPKGLKKALHKTDPAGNAAVIRDYVIWATQTLFTGHCSFDISFSVENLPHLNDE